jgi:hypothetical protein
MLKRLYLSYRFMLLACMPRPQHSPAATFLKHKKDLTDLEEYITVSGATSVPYIIKNPAKKCLAIDDPF